MAGAGGKLEDFLFAAVVSEGSVPMDQSVGHLPASLLSLVSDPVPKEKVLLPKALRQTLLEKEMLRTIILKLLRSFSWLCSLTRTKIIHFFASLEPKIQNAIETTLLEDLNWHPVMGAQRCL